MYVHLDKIGEPIQKVDGQFWSDTLNSLVRKSSAERYLIRQSRRVLSQMNEGFFFIKTLNARKHWIIWTIQKAAKTVDLQIGAPVSSFLFEDLRDLRDIVVIIQMELLQLFHGTACRLGRSVESIL